MVWSSIIVSFMLLLWLIFWLSSVDNNSREPKLKSGLKISSELATERVKFENCYNMLYQVGLFPRNVFVEYKDHRSLYNDNVFMVTRLVRYEGGYSCLPSKMLDQYFYLKFSNNIQRDNGRNIKGDGGIFDAMTLEFVKDFCKFYSGFLEAGKEEVDLLKKYSAPKEIENFFLEKNKYVAKEINLI